MESPDIQDNLLGHSEQLLLKKKPVFSVRNMAVLHDIGGVGVGSDTFLHEFSYTGCPKKMGICILGYF